MFSFLYIILLVIAYSNSYCSGRTEGFQEKSKKIRISGYFLFALARAVRDDRLETLGTLLHNDQEWESLAYEEKMRWNERAAVVRRMSLGAQHKRVEEAYKTRHREVDTAKAGRLDALRLKIRRQLGLLTQDLLPRQ